MANVWKHTERSKKDGKYLVEISIGTAPQGQFTRGTLFIRFANTAEKDGFSMRITPAEANDLAAAIRIVSERLEKSITVLNRNGHGITVSHEADSFFICGIKNSFMIPVDMDSGRFGFFGLIAADFAPKACFELREDDEVMFRTA